MGPGRPTARSWLPRSKVAVVAGGTVGGFGGRWRLAGEGGGGPFRAGFPTADSDTAGDIDTVAFPAARYPGHGPDVPTWTADAVTRLRWTRVATDKPAPVTCPAGNVSGVILAHLYRGPAGSTAQGIERAHGAYR